MEISDFAALVTPIVAILNFILQVIKLILEIHNKRK